ncbi:Ring finger domain [Phytophthora infestans]|uniref:RING-type E3 ubiquitin transferase n=1 Tax=Phytophthora infestans TaxID=4787 RepID=A0A833TCZ3_PHYIN|nr:Ring finger domain [Phytophthora infestans]KAF4134058.1 Ring finger domain [Phytophthora infestans]
MGQNCSCLEHPPKYQRRQSDDLDTVDMERGDDDDDQELEVLVGVQESHELLGARSRTSSGGGSNQGIVLKRSGSPGLMADAGRKDDEDEEKETEEQRMRRSLSMGLLGLDADHYPTPSPRPEELSRLLRSYQEVTGVVDEGQLDLECIMCLDTFSEDNPKVRTLCNCGMNRTNFHMSCLLEWLNRDANCPVCREYLFFEDS